MSPPSPPRNGFMPAQCGHFFVLNLPTEKEKARLRGLFSICLLHPAIRIRVSATFGQLT